MNRRKLLQTTAAAAASTALLPRSAPASATTAPGIEVLDTRVVSWEADLYHGWPTITRRADGELWAVWSGGRESHICPFGKLCAMSSRDQGETWTYPRVLLDGPLDDRDGGIVETAEGTLLATTFTSLAYEDRILKRILALTDEELEAEEKWNPERLRRWLAARDRLSEEERRNHIGQWLVRSTDGGITWSERLPTLVGSPHGPCVTRDGRLLYPGKEMGKGAEARYALTESTDDGLTWQWVTDLPVRPGDRSGEYHELHMVEAANGDLVLHIRNHNPENKLETLQCESSDGGKTWSDIRPLGVQGYPSHLLRLRDGRLLMSYGRRLKPYGNRARISEDHGRTWSDPLVISEDGTSIDLGYPSTVERDDGSFLTLWYEKIASNPKSVLRQAIWRLA